MSEVKIICCQFSRISGPNATASYKIEFELDESHRKDIQQLLDYKKGSPVLLMIYDGTDSGLQQISTASKDDDIKYLNKKLHAIIDDIAAKKGVSPDVIKQKLKNYLIDNGIIEKSTSELDARGYGLAISFLKNE